MNDAIPAFIATMASAGIVPLESISSALASGELIRFRAEGDKPGRRNGWAILHLDGTPAGCFGHYRLGVRATWRSGETRDLSRADRQAVLHQLSLAEVCAAKRVRGLGGEKRRRTVKEAQPLWNPALARARDSKVPGDSGCYLCELAAITTSQYRVSFNRLPVQSH